MPYLRNERDDEGRCEILITANAEIIVIKSRVLLIMKIKTKRIFTDSVLPIPGSV